MAVVHSTRLLPKIYLMFVKNCQNLRRIPLLRVPTRLVCGLVHLHHLLRRAMSFLPAVIYYRNSKTNSIFISVRSNKFPSSSFTERVKLFADLPCEVSRESFFFLFALHVTLSYGLPLTGWLTRPSDRSPFKKFFCLLTRTQLIKYVLGLL